MHRRCACSCVPASRRRTPLLCAAALLLGGPARSLGASDIEQWCLGATGTFTVADLSAGTIKSRLFHARSCWWLMQPGKTQDAAAEVCAAGHPERPADVRGRLAVVRSRRVYEALVAGLGLAANSSPYIGLRYTSGAHGAPAGWYHEAGPADAWTWRLPADRYSAPWAEVNTVTGSYGIISGNGLGVYGRPGGIRLYVCQFAHENERPAAYRIIAGGARDMWPAPAVQLGNHTVSPVGGGRVAECGAHCAAHMLCAGFAVDLRSAHCVTAIDVLDESALEAKHGYQVYERLVR